MKINRGEMLGDGHYYNIIMLHHIIGISLLISIL